MTKRRVSPQTATRHPNGCLFWKEKLNYDTLKKVERIITDYEEALKRVRQTRHTSTDMRRKNDIYGILFARGQETEYSVDEVYAVFEDVSPSAIRKARNYLTENTWQFTPPDEREKVIYSLFTAVKIYSYADLFCDFSESGYICPLQILTAITAIQISVKSGFPKYLIQF